MSVVVAGDDRAVAVLSSPIDFGPDIEVHMFTNLMYVTSCRNRALCPGPRRTEAFGFEKRADYHGPEGRFLTMAIGGSQEVLLWPGTAGRAGTTGSPQISIPGPLIIESDDLRKDFEVLRSLGVQFTDGEPEDYPFGVRATALDPDGNRVSLRQTRKAHV